MFISFLWAEHPTHNPKVDRSNPATGTGLIIYENIKLARLHEEPTNIRLG